MREIQTPTWFDMAENRINNLPESWLTLLDGHDASGWLGAFAEAPKKAVADLLWDTFYFGLLNLTERGQLLSGWLDLLGNSNHFAEQLDAEFADWVEQNWGQFDRRAESLISAWSCLCTVVEFSAKLPEDSRLKNCATVLRARFDERQRFLGSFSYAPAADPLGLYLAVVAEFQGDDRSLIGFWHGMCNLSDGVPFYHARYAMLGLRRLKATDPLENGTLRAEIVMGLFRLARAFDRLVRERWLPEKIAQLTFRRVAVQTAAAYPDSPRWREHGSTGVLQLPERAQKWILEAIPPLADSLRREKNKRTQHSTRSRSLIEPDPNWPKKGRELAALLRRGDRLCLPDVMRLLDEERRFAEATGDTYNVVRSLCNFASRVLAFSPPLALRWAEEARRWEPDNDYTWNTVRTVFLKRQQLSEAACFAWVAWKRFPEDVVAHNGLAEVLKALHRYDEAAAVYRQTIESFSDNINAQNGLADTLRRSGHHKEAEVEYRKAIQSGTADPATFVGLAYLYLVLRKGKESARAEALELVGRALKLDPRNHYARSLKQNLMPESQANLDDLVNEWDEVADIAFEEPKLMANGKEKWAGEHEAKELSGLEQRQLAVQPKGVPKVERSAHLGSENVQTRKSEAQLPGTEKPQPVLNQTITAEAKPFTPISSDIEPQLFRLSNSLAVAALVAEAYFYRIWAKGADIKLATVCRQKAADLITHAEDLSPQDPQVLAERVALSVDQGDESVAYESLAKLSNRLAAAPLLVLKARLDRERARKENRSLNYSTLAELCNAPERLRDLNPALMPLFNFQKGLAALSLRDGAVRIETAANAFLSFRRILAHRAAEEEKERKASDPSDHLRFHEWLRIQVNDRVFSGIAEVENVDVRFHNITFLENIWERRQTAVEEIEDVFADRLAFRII